MSKQASLRVGDCVVDATVVQLVAGECHRVALLSAVEWAVGAATSMGSARCR